jgi:hypothetical protein
MSLFIKDFTYTFSYWIFAWFLFYELGWISYNPMIFLILASFDNLFLLFGMIYFKNSWKYILLFIFINFFIKVIPIIILSNYFANIRNIANILSDIYFGIALFLFYNAFLLLNRTNIWIIFKETWQKIRENKPFSPLIKNLFG